MSTRRISDEQIRLTDIPNNATLAASGDAIVGIRNNLSASDAPDGGDNFAAGYSVGSLWQWGARVWRCYGDGQWDELLRNPSGAADGKILGHAGGVPIWTNSPIPFGSLYGNKFRNTDGYIVWDNNLLSGDGLISIYSSGSGSGRNDRGFTVANDGTYEFNWTCRVNTNAAHGSFVELHKNGSLFDQIHTYYSQADATLFVTKSATAIRPLAASDRVELYFNENTVGELNAYNGSSFTIKKLA